MAERRMFAKTIIDSDAFLDMPSTTQALYFHLGMRADDDGFINAPKSIMRLCGAKDDDMNLLIVKKFIIPFENGVVVIKHWKINNYIQKDRYTETKYAELKKTLELDENGAYKTPNNGLVYTMDTQCIQNGYTGKDSIGKDSIVNNIYIGQNDLTDTPKSTSLFELFWVVYPKKVGKTACIKWFERKKPSKELVSKMVSAIKLQIPSRQWKEGYIPNPLTWLNQGRWDDVVDVEKPALELTPFEKSGLFPQDKLNRYQYLDNVIRSEEENKEFNQLREEYNQALMQFNKKEAF